MPHIRREHAFDHVLEILSSPETDLRRLATLAGGDPRTFYRGADLRNVDLRGQDLRGMEFTARALRGAIYDQSTLFEPGFEPLDYGPLREQGVEISNALYDYLDKYAAESGLRYKSRAIKSLIMQVYERFNDDPVGLGVWRNALYSQEEYRRHFRAPRRSRRNFKVFVSLAERAFLRRLGAGLSGRSAGYTAAVLIGLALQGGLSPIATIAPDDDLFASIRGRGV